MVADSGLEVGADGSIEDTYEANKLLGLVLSDDASAVLGDVVTVVKDVMPYAKAAIGAIKFIYERVESSKMVVREVQDFVQFVQVIERAVCKAATLFKTETKLFLEDLARKLEDAKALVKKAQQVGLRRSLPH